MFTRQDGESVVGAGLFLFRFEGSVASALNVYQIYNQVKIWEERKGSDQAFVWTMASQITDFRDAVRRLLLREQLIVVSNDAAFAGAGCEIQPQSLGSEACDVV